MSTCLEPIVSLNQLRSWGEALGLSVVGASPASLIELDMAHLTEWQELGYAGEMAYMRREPSRLADPRVLLAGAKSVVSFAIGYSRRAREPLKRGYGRVARYAWGQDYHELLRRCLDEFVAYVERQLERPLKFRLFSDAVPLLERGFARKAGLGFVGKNTMLIRRGQGSLFFLAEVLWDLEVEVAPQYLGRCGACVRCQRACPTSALSEDYRLDARRCISYLTIEKRGMLSEWERRAVGDWVFGCDVCQEVCPFNHQALSRELRADLEALERESGAGEALFLPELLRVRSDREFLERFRGTALLRTKREGLLRNAAVVAANTGAVICFEALREAAQQDSSEVVREHARWALSELER